MTHPTPPTHAVNERARDRWAATALFVAPLVMFAGFFGHPFMPTLGPEAVDKALHANEDRWFVSHLLIAVGSGLLAVAFVALRRLLRTHGEDRFSAWALPWTILGSTMLVLPPGMELGMLAAARGGVDVVQAQLALDVYFIPLLMASNVLFLVGSVGFALGLRRARVPSGAASAGVVVALLVMAVVRFIPSGIQFYIGGVAGLAALWPLAYAQWQAASGAPRRDAARHATA